jgi:hypothetical protein
MVKAFWFLRRFGFESAFVLKVFGAAAPSLAFAQLAANPRRSNT